MPQAGDNNIGASGTRQGRYTPQLRMYYDDDNHGLCCDVIDLEFLGTVRGGADRAAAQKEAVRRGKEWIKKPGAGDAIEKSWDIRHNAQVLGIINPHVVALRVLESV